MADTSFSSAEWLRYTRHIQLPQVGAEGQVRLKQSRVLMVGAGGLGSPVAFYLAAAGVGHITIIDGDTIDLTNLQRQILFKTTQLGQSKAECARDTLLALNPDINVTAISEHFSPKQADELVAQVDLVLDCTDNFTTRYLINEVCVKQNKPWLFASIYQFSGQCALFVPGYSDNAACFRCLFPEPPQGVADCNTAGVMGVLPGFLGCLQANEAIKYLVGLPCPLINTLMMVETLDLSFKKITLAKHQDCPVCSKSASKGACAKVEFANTPDSHCEIGKPGLSPEEFMLQRDSGKTLLLDVRSLEERSAFHIGGEHIPLDQLPKALAELDSDKHILCYCQSGARSAKAVTLLKQHQFMAQHLDNGLVALLRHTLTP